MDDNPNDNPYVAASNGLTPPPEPDTDEAVGIGTNSLPPATTRGFGRVQHG